MLPGDSEMDAFSLVVPRRVTVTRGDGAVLLTLSARRSDEPLVTWAVTPGTIPELQGPELTDWVESIGRIAVRTFDGHWDDHDAPDAERIEHVANGTTRAARRLGNEFRVAVHEIHTRDGDDWFR